MTDNEACKTVKEKHGHEFDIEYVGLATGKEVRYVNRGDPYLETLCSVDDGKTWFWASWGDLLEEAAAERFEETGEEPCCYCGEYAECEYHNGPNWSGYACENCRSG